MHPLATEMRCVVAARRENARARTSERAGVETRGVVDRWINKRNARGRRGAEREGALSTRARLIARAFGLVARN